MLHFSYTIKATTKPKAPTKPPAFNLPTATFAVDAEVPVEKLEALLAVALETDGLEEDVFAATRVLAPVPEVEALLAELLRVDIEEAIPVTVVIDPSGAVYMPLFTFPFPPTSST